MPTQQLPLTENKTRLELLILALTQGVDLTAYLILHTPETETKLQLGKDM